MNFTKQDSPRSPLVEQDMTASEALAHTIRDIIYREGELHRARARLALHRAEEGQQQKKWPCKVRNLDVRSIEWVRDSPSASASVAPSFAVAVSDVRPAVEEALVHSEQVFF